MTNVTRRCLWTNKRDDRLIEVELEGPGRFGTGRKKTTVYVLPEHEEKLRAFAEYFRRFALFFLVAITALTLASVIAGISGSMIGSGISIIALGAVILIFPFATPETVKMVGLRRSILLPGVRAFF